MKNSMIDNINKKNPHTTALRYMTRNFFPTSHVDSMTQQHNNNGKSTISITISVQRMDFYSYCCICIAMARGQETTSDFLFFKYVNTIWMSRVMITRVVVILGLILFDLDLKRIQQVKTMHMTLDILAIELLMYSEHDRVLAYNIIIILHPLPLKYY